MSYVRPIVKDKSWVLDYEADFWEGASYTNAVPAGKAATTAGTALLAANTNIIKVPVGFVGNIKGLIISSDGPCQIKGYIQRGRFAAAGIAKTYQVIDHTFGTGSGQLELKFGPLGLDLLEGNGINLGITATSTVNPNVSVTCVDPKIFFNDYNFNARNTYLVLSDSIGWTNVGNVGAGATPNLGTSLYCSRINSRLRAAGVDSRIVHKGFGGSGALLYRWLCESDGLGNLDWSTIGLVTIQIGSNDAVNGLATASSPTFAAEYTSILNYIFSKNPRASVVAIGPPPTTETSRTTNIASYRTALSSLVSGWSTTFDLKYFDATTGFATPTGANDANFAETTLTTYLHPRGDTGHSLIDANLWPVVQTTRFYTQKGYDL